MRVKASTLLRLYKARDDSYLNRFFYRVKKAGGRLEVIWDIERTKENEEAVFFVKEIVEETIRLFSFLE